MNMTAFLMLLLVLPAQPNDPVAELSRKDISNEARDRLVERLRRSDPSATAPAILKLMRVYCSPTEPGMEHKPWMNDRHSHKAKVWYASCAIWDTLFAGQSEWAKVAVLLKLLESDKDTYSRHVVLKTLRFQWNATAEQPIFRLIQDRDSPDTTKMDALQVLLERCGETYVSYAIQFVEHSPAKDRLDHFQRVFNVGNRFFSCSPENQDRIVALGFTILQMVAKPGDATGYGVARQLGFFVRAPNEFAPDQRGYRGLNGLTERFFSDTVQNALDWRKKHGPKPKG